MQWILYSMLSVSCTLTGVVLTKQWIAQHEMKWFGIALFFFTCSSLAYMKALQFERIAMVEVVWSIIAIVLSVILGYFFFQEKISLQEMIGVCLAIIAMILVTVKL